MRRRSAVAALIALVLTTAGCIGTAPGSPTAPESPTALPAPSGSIDFSEGPKDSPERPPTLNDSSVHEYVGSYEHRYAYNSLWVNENSTVTLACRVDTVTEQPWGYEGVVTCTGSSETDGLNGDWFTQSYRYRVSETALNRTQIEPRDPVS
jgi:hypothetical protein